MKNQTDHQEAERGYCADCDNFGGYHSKGCKRRPERFFRAARRNPAAAAVGAGELPALPKSVGVVEYGVRGEVTARLESAYTANQMQQYARDAIAADRRARSLAPMCERKTAMLEAEGYEKAGYVLRQPGKDREVAVCDGGAVSWFTLEQWNWLMFNRDHIEFSWPKPVGQRTNIPAQAGSEKEAP